MGGETCKGCLVHRRKLSLLPPPAAGVPPLVSSGLGLKVFLTDDIYVAIHPTDWDVEMNDDEIGRAHV